MQDSPNGQNGSQSPPPRHKLGFVGQLAKQFIDSKLTPLIIIVAILLGIGATLMLPREEEPQITVQRRMCLCRCQEHRRRTWNSASQHRWRN